jgi:hypothetical protein
MKQRQFQVQNVLFITPTNAEHINEQFNSSVCSTGLDKTHLQVNVMLVSHFYPLLLPTSVTTTQYIYSGRAKSRKLIVSRCVRTQVSTLLSSWSYPVLMEGITRVKFSGQYVNFYSPQKLRILQTHGTVVCKQQNVSTLHKNVASSSTLTNWLKTFQIICVVFFLLA